MFIILVYDIKNRKSDSFKKICRKYLVHVQKSVFEGIISKKNYYLLLSELKPLLCEDVFLKIYILNSKKQLQFYIYGESHSDKLLV